MTRIKIIFIPSLVFLYLLMLNIFTPPHSDDWLYILSTADSMDSSMFVFFNWNSRLGELLFSSLMANIPMFWFDFTNAFVACLFFMSLFYALFMKLPDSLYDLCILLLIIVLVILLTPFDELFLWGSGSLNYLWGFALSSLFIIVYIRLPDMNNVLFAICMFIMGFIIGMWHESTSSLVLFALICYLCFFRVGGGKRALPIWFYVGIIGLICGFILLYMSPGNNNRIINESDKYSYISVGYFMQLSMLDKISRIYVVLNKALHENPIFFPVASFIISFCKTFGSMRKITLFLFCFISLFLFTIIVLYTPLAAYLILWIMFIYIYIKSKDSNYLIALIFLGLYLVSILSTFQLLHLPYRARGIGIILLILIVVILLKQYLLSKRLCIILVSCFICYLSYIYYVYYDLGNKWDRLVYFIDNAKNAYHKDLESLNVRLMNTHDVNFMGYPIDIIVPRDMYSFSYRGFSNWWRLSGDINNDINQSYSFIFKVKSIRLE